MPILVDIIIALCLIGYNTYEIVRINVFKIDRNAIFTGLTSMLSIGFGLYLIVKNGLILDYGTQSEISINWAGEMGFLGFVCLFIGLGFILSSIVKYIIWKLKRNEHNTQ